MAAGADSKAPQPPEPVPVWEVLGEEYRSQPGAPSPDAEYDDALDAYRRARQAWHAAGRPEGGRPACEAAEHAFRRILVARLHAAKRKALCFSGGGIRSATFGLGVAEGLAARSWSAKHPGAPPVLLGELDYLSTVSGGGYLGGWLSAWAARHQEGFPGVVKELAAAPDSGWEPEPEPLRRLRRFSNYLNPQLGAFSADSWTLAATVLRNIVLNWLVLLPLLAAVLVLPRLFFALVSAYPSLDSNILLYAGSAMLVTAVAYMVVDLPSAGNARLPQSRYLAFGLSPMLLSAFCFALYWAWQGDLHAVPGPSSYVKFGTLVMAAGILAGMPLALWKRRSFEVIWMVKGAVFALVKLEVLALGRAVHFFKQIGQARARRKRTIEIRERVACGALRLVAALRRAALHRLNFLAQVGKPRLLWPQGRKIEGGHEHKQSGSDDARCSDAAERCLNTSHVSLPCGQVASASRRPAQSGPDAADPVAAPDGSRDRRPRASVAPEDRERR